MKSDPGLFCLIFILDIHTTSDTTEVLLFLWSFMARCKEHRQGEKHLKPTSYTNTLLSTTTKKKKEKKKMLFTQLSFLFFFLDLNFKHTSITQQHVSPTYIVPLDRYSLLLLKALVPAVLKKNPQSCRLGRIICQAQICILYKLFFFQSFAVNCCSNCIFFF